VSLVYQILTHYRINLTQHSCCFLLMNTVREQPKIVEDIDPV